jgi:protein SCO1/2
MITRIKRALLLILSALALLLAAPLAFAQGSRPPSPKDVGFDQKLGARIPLDVTLHDEDGRDVRVADIFGRKRPVVLAFAYYECPMLCTMVLNGLVGSMKGMNLTVGVDYELVVVSVDPRDTPERARAKKASYVELYDRRRPETEAGIHFLTGAEPSLRALASAAGFRYVYDAATGQYAHPAGAIVLTETGEIARYLFGIDFAPRDLRLALVEAGNGRIGGPADRLMLLCFQYDPARGNYGALAMGLVRAGGVLTLVVLGASIVFMNRRRRASVIDEPPKREG